MPVASQDPPAGSQEIAYQHENDVRHKQNGQRKQRKGAREYHLREQRRFSADSRAKHGGIR